MDFLLLLLGWEPHTLSLQFLTRWKMRTIKNLTSDPCVLTLWDMALTGSLANLYTTEYSLYSDEIFSLSSLVLTHMRLSKQTFKSTIDNFIWLAILFSFWLVLASSVLWPFLVTKYYMEWTESFYQQKCLVSIVYWFRWSVTVNTDKLYLCQQLIQIGLNHDQSDHRDCHGTSVEKLLL